MAKAYLVDNGLFKLDLVASGHVSTTLDQCTSDLDTAVLKQTSRLLKGSSCNRCTNIRL